MLPRAEALAALQRRLAAAMPTPLADTPPLRAALEAIARAERRVVELAAKRVVVGLLGGTGVGKSALLNALAGAEIARSSERRPTTDRIVCHRHEADPLPAWLELADLATATPVHTAAALRGVVLLDLPDVDSWKPEHRERTWRAIPHLDLLLVVSSVEKYGDRVLYQELAALPQAARNRVFVLNQRDRLDGDSLALVAADFATKLESHASVVAPRILAVSALEAMRGGDGGLVPLRQLLTELGADAERRAVLEANAVRAVVDAAGALDNALPHAALVRALAAIDATLEPPAAPGPGERARLIADLEAEVGPWIDATARRASSFPIGWIDFWTGRLRHRASPAPPASPAARPGILAADHADALLRRPVAIARRRAEDALRASDGVLAVALPPAPDWTDAVTHDPGITLPSVAAWLAELPGRARQLAFRWRQHAFPLAVVMVVALRLGAQLSAAPTGRGVAGALGEALRDLTASVTLASACWALAALVLWYALVWSYFVYRLARGVHDEMERGADAQLADFAAQWDALWRCPLRAESERLRALIADLVSARAMLGPPPG